MKILLLGCNGQVGWELQRSLSILGAVISLDRKGSNGLSGDLSELNGIRNTIRVVRPDVIVNAAAYTNVERAESEPELARKINAHAPAVLAEEALACGSLLVHYSTDYVFDGSGSIPWSEASDTSPLNEYGRSKLAGDLAVQGSGCDHLIFRTSWVFSGRGHNFLKSMTRLIVEKQSLTVVEDQFGAPTSAELIADVTAHALSKTYNDRGLGGLYNLAAGGVTSWYLYASFIANWMREHGVMGVMPEQNITGIAASDYHAAALRPLNSRLDTRRLESSFDLHLPFWGDGVQRVLSEYFYGNRSIVQ